MLKKAMYLLSPAQKEAVCGMPLLEIFLGEGAEGCGLRRPGERVLVCLHPRKVRRSIYERRPRHSCQKVLQLYEAVHRFVSSHRRIQQHYFQLDLPLLVGFGRRHWGIHNLVL
jgi:hypothetical protein